MKLHRLTTGVILFATGIAIVCSILYGLSVGNINRGFAEGQIGTVTSLALLALVAVASFQIYGLRKRGKIRCYRDSRNVWFLIGLGFAFLTMDEGMQIHENMDKLFHHLSDITETAFTDRIDDLIILSYGLIGLGILIAWRREILRVPGLTTYIAVGFALMVVQVGLDAMTNGKEYLDWLGVSDLHADAVSSALKLAEDITKLLAGAVLLAGMTHALRTIRHLPDSTSSGGHMRDY